MTVPLTDQQLAVLVTRLTYRPSLQGPESNPWLTLHNTVADQERDRFIAAAFTDVPVLLAEVTRLRAERDRLLAFADWTASNTRPLTDIHTAALTAIDTPSTRAALADLAQIAAEVAAFVAADEAEGHQPHCVAATQGCCSCEDPAAPACSCGAEPVHQRGCQPA